MKEKKLRIFLFFFVLFRVLLFFFILCMLSAANLLSMRLDIDIRVLPGIDEKYEGKEKKEGRTAK